MVQRRSRTEQEPVRGWRQRWLPAAAFVAAASGVLAAAALRPAPPTRPPRSETAALLTVRPLAEVEPRDRRVLQEAVRRLRQLDPAAEADAAAVPRRGPPGAWAAWEVRGPSASAVRRAADRLARRLAEATQAAGRPAASPASEAQREPRAPDAPAASAPSHAAWLRESAARLTALAELIAKPSDATGAAAGGRWNPAWIELSQRLEQLDAAREALLARLTPAHPKVAALDEERAALARQLAGTPQRLPGPPQDGSSPREALRGPLLALAAEWTAAADRWDRLEQAPSGAEARREAASRPPAPGWLVELQWRPPAPEAHDAWKPALQAGLAWAAALLAGAVAAGLATRCARPRRIRRPDEAARAARAPLLGVVDASPPLAESVR